MASHLKVEEKEDMAKDPQDKAATVKDMMVKGKEAKEEKVTKDWAKETVRADRSSTIAMSVGCMGTRSSSVPNSERVLKATAADAH